MQTKFKKFIANLKRKTNRKYASNRVNKTWIYEELEKYEE